MHGTHDLKEFEALGIQVLDDYLAALNSGDIMRWAGALHYPHIRIAGGTVRVWETPEAFAKENDMTRLIKRVNWGHNKWDWRRLVQFGPEKMHFTVKISRYTVGDELISSFESLYIITRLDKRWGVQGRSSYAGDFAPGK